MKRCSFVINEMGIMRWWRLVCLNFYVSWPFGLLPHFLHTQIPHLHPRMDQSRSSLSLIKLPAIVVSFFLLIVALSLLSVVVDYPVLVDNKCRYVYFQFR